jgi:molybdenum cofactor cytidylyltransferase
MGKPKLLLPWQGGAVLGRVLENAMAGGISPLTVVCGAAAKAVAAEAETKGLPWLLNKDYDLGQSTSLICGLKAVPPGFGVMFILGDMPAVQPQSYAALAAAYIESRALIVVPVNDAGRRGNPTVWAPELFSELKLLSGDMGARDLMAKYHKQTLLVPLDDQGLYTDIDTPADYQKLIVYSEDGYAGG